MIKKGLKNNILFFLVIILGIISDFFSKMYIISNFNLNESRTIIPYILSINYRTNSGAGFSILEGQIWLFILVSIIVLCTGIYYYREIIKNRTLAISTSLIAAGTIGNLIDRIAYGYVVDFIDISFWWPSFNIADSCLTIGVIILIYYFWKKERLGSC